MARTERQGEKLKLCEDWLSNQSLEQLLLITLLLSSRRESVIKSDEGFLIDKCTDLLFSAEYQRESDKLAILKKASSAIQLVTPSFDQLYWIPEYHSKRLEAFLRRSIDYIPIEIDGYNKKTQFKLNYIVQSAKHPGITKLKKLQEDWQKLENTNEFDNLKIPDEVDFIKYFSKKYREWINNQESIYNSKKITSKNIYSIEDALVWLDLYSFESKKKANLDSRSLLLLLVRKIHKSWKQKYDRKHSKNIQKNFSISQSTNKRLERMSTLHRVSQTEIISILINEEYDKITHLKHL